MSADWPGTLDQQAAVRKTLSVDFGDNRHKFMKRLDTTTNLIWDRSFLIVGFLPDDMFPPDWLAVAGVSGVSMRAGFALSAIGRMLEHEVGHVADKHLLTQEMRYIYMQQKGIDPNLNIWNWNVQEMWADDFQAWFSTDGAFRPELTPWLT